MGLPAALQATEDDWIVTFLHEAFHQYQSDLPGYATAVDRVRTQLGQTGGQWMLDYQFPYSDPAVKAAFGAMTASAAEFLRADSDAKAIAAIRDYVRARHLAREAAGANNWLYYEFQVGQEGVARWTELRLARAAGSSRPDIAAIGRERDGGLAVSLTAIDEQGVEIWKRSAFYVLGAIEASMLERARPHWQREYLADPFSMGSMLDALIEAAPARFTP